MKCNATHFVSPIYNSKTAGLLPPSDSLYKSERMLAGTEDLADSDVLEGICYAHVVPFAGPWACMRLRVYPPAFPAQRKSPIPRMSLTLMPYRNCRIIISENSVAITHHAI